MRWKTEPYPKENDTRTVKTFALIPTRMDDDTTVWLEYYYEDQRFVKVSDFEYEWVLDWMIVRTYANEKEQ